AFSCEPWKSRRIDHPRIRRADSPSDGLQSRIEVRALAARRSSQAPSRYFQSQKHSWMGAESSARRRTPRNRGVFQRQSSGRRHAMNPFMEQAIRLAIENVRSNTGGPFAAVVVKDDKIIATGTNRVTSTNDPTAHAEVVAIRAACAALGSFQLDSC